jgi:hypothetical protein
MQKIKYLLLSLIFFSSITQAFDTLTNTPFDPNLFQYYSIDNLNAGQTDGTVGAGENITSLGNTSTTTATPFSIYSGGTVTLSSNNDTTGGIEAAGTISANNLSGTCIQGNINGGANLTMSNTNSSQVIGNVKLAGSTNLSPSRISGTLVQNIPYVPTLNLNNATNATAQTVGNVINITAGTGQAQNIVNLTLSQINGKTLNFITQTGNQFFVLNLTNLGNLSSYTISGTEFNGTAGSSSSPQIALLNLIGNQSLTVNGTIWASTLAIGDSLTLTTMGGIQIMWL